MTVNLKNTTLVDHQLGTSSARRQHKRTILNMEAFCGCILIYLSYRFLYECYVLSELRYDGLRFIFYSFTLSLTSTCPSLSVNKRDLFNNNRHIGPNKSSPGLQQRSKERLN